MKTARFEGHHEARQSLVLAVVGVTNHADREFDFADLVLRAHLLKQQAGGRAWCQTAIRPYQIEGRAMRGFHNTAFDPQTLMLLEAAFDGAWLTQ